MNNAPNTIVVKIVWISLIVSQCIYLGLPVPEAAGGRDDLPMLAGALAFVALSEAVGAFAWFRIGAVGRIQGGHIDPSSVEGAGQLFQVLIVCWVLAESIAIYGLVLRFMHAPLWMTAPFAVVAFVSMGAMNPFQSGLSRPVASAERGRDPTPIG
jgi:hypothetical protein